MGYRHRRRRMGIGHASRLDRLEALFQMDEPRNGIVPPPIWAAMLDWIQTCQPEQYHELQQLLYRVPAGATGNEQEPAWMAYSQRLDELAGQWARAGHPDPAGRLRHIH